MLDNLMSLQPAASDPAPNGEHRFAWGKIPDKKQADPHAGATPELGENAMPKNPEVPQEAATKNNPSEKDVENITAERRKRILMQVPSTLLSKYTLGAFYLTDTLLGLLPERELRTLAERVTGTPEESGIDLMNLENIETILARIFRERGDDTTMAKKLKKLLEHKLLQYEELRAKAEELIAKKQNIPVDRIGPLEQQLALQGHTIDSWLRTASTAQICDALKMPQMRENQRASLLARIREYLETKRRLENWNMPGIDRNAQLRNMLAEGNDITGIQKQLYEETRAVLPVLAEIIREQIREEAAKTRTWLKAEYEKYDGDLPAVSLRNCEGIEDAADASFLQKHGVSAHALAREIEGVEAAITLAEGTDSGSSVEKVIDTAALCERLRDMREHPGNGGQYRAIITGPANEQKSAEAWAQEMRGGLDTILKDQYPTRTEREPIERVFGVADLFGELAKVRGDLTPSDRNPKGVNGYYYPAKRRQQLLFLVQSLRQQRIVAAVQAQRELVTQEQEQGDLTVMDLVEKTRQKLGVTVGELVQLPALKRGIADVIGVPKHLEQRRLTLENTLNAITAQRSRVAHATVADVRVEVEKLSTAARMLRTLETIQAVLLSSAEFTERTGTNMYAAYDYATAEILVNEERCRKEKRDIAGEIDHEKEHAVQDILTRRAGVFPFLHRAAYEVLAEEDTAFTEQLVEQAKAWGLAGQLDQIRKSTKTEQEAQAILQELLTEELLNRYVDWKQGKLQEPTANEKSLFATIERAQLVEHMQGHELVQRETSAARADIQPIKLFASGAATESPTQAPATESATGSSSTEVSAENDESDEGEKKGPLNVRGKLDGCKIHIKKIEEFATAYPAYQGDLKEALPVYKQNHSTLEEIFQTQTMDGKPFPKPEENPIFVQQVTELHKELGDIYKQVQKASNEMHDLSNEKASGLTGWRAFFQNIYFLSALDIYLMYKDTIEDIKRMWQRRSKQARSAVAQGLFGMIPENEIAGLRYFGRLAKENEKREQQAEDEEVDVWKEGLKNKDAYQLMEILAHIKHNKDQVKAIMYLLAEKGRINWSDENIWRVLNRHSNYEIPIAQCKRDIILRNNWLNKIIYDIWDDKDLFLDWRTTNDNAFTTGRDKFNDFVDTLSQNPRAMSAELERILRIYCKCKENNEIPPQDVNPQLYEKILEFAMMKGKMNMEQKFYFLIKGIAVGLLPLERINILNNQVLGTFPFIDYFANQNNSLPEVQALAAKLTETNPYKPGMKTTLFLELEVARDESTRSRVIKTIGSGGDKIDHEDAPMLMAFLDHGGINQMLQPMTGQKQRMTQEAVKNSYVGFDTLFKTYARAAELESDGIARFTKNDALHLGRSLMAFIHFDNIVLQAAGDKQNRQSVTWEQIENETMPSGGDRTPSQFRNPMGALAEDMFRSYGITEVEVGKDKDKKPVMVSINDYLGALRGKRPIMSDEEKKKIFDATKLFQQELMEKIAGNPETFKEVLRRSTEGANALLEEGDEEMTKDAVRRAMEKKAA